MGFFCSASHTSPMPPSPINCSSRYWPMSSIPEVIEIAREGEEPAEADERTEPTLSSVASASGGTEAEACAAFALDASKCAGPWPGKVPSFRGRSASLMHPSVPRPLRSESLLFGLACWPYCIPGDGHAQCRGQRSNAGEFSDRQWRLLAHQLEHRGSRYVPC